MKSSHKIFPSRAIGATLAGCPQNAPNHTTARGAGRRQRRLGGRLSALAALLATLILAPNLHAQQPARGEAKEERPMDVPDGDGVVRTKDVKVLRFRPEEIPMTFRLEQPTRVILRLQKLPKPPALAELKKTQRVLRPRVVEIVALLKPRFPYRNSPMIYRGHAVWVSEKEGGADPVLISTLFWLEQADELYLVPTALTRPAVKQTRKNPTVRRVSLDQAVAGKKELERFQAERAKYVPLKLRRKDRWRNLSHLVAKKGHKLGLPKDGLRTFDSIYNPLSYLYGFSPLAGPSMSPAAILSKKPEEEELSFYFQTTHSGTLASPLVTKDGEVVVLNAMLHPKKKGVALAIPPLALREFIRKQQGLVSLQTILTRKEQAPGRSLDGKKKTDAKQ